MAKVCANHLALLRHRPLYRLGHLDQAQGHRHRSVLRGRFHGRRGLRRDRAERPVRRRLQEARHQGRQAGRRRASTATPWTASWYFKLLRAGTKHQRHPRPPDVRRDQSRRHRAPGPEPRAGDGRRAPRSAAATASAKATIVKAIKDKGLFTLDEVRKHTKASSSCGSCTGLVEQLLMATAGGDYSAAPKQEGAVRLHRPHAPGGARRDPRAAPADDRAGLRAPRWRTPNGCATLPPGAQLLPDLHLAARGEGRSAVALHQRARARQHPEGRHLLGGAAHVGRRNQRLRTAAHRRRRRQVQDPDRSRSPAASASTCSA